MKNKSTKNPEISVPKQVFDQFLKSLGKNGVDTDLIKRLKNTIMKQNKISETDIKTALFTENTTDV